MHQHNYFMGAIGLTLLLVACDGDSDPPTGTPTPTGNQLGLDFDGLPRRFGADDTEFSRTHAHWLRAFYDVTVSLATMRWSVAPTPSSTMFMGVSTCWCLATSPL